MLRRFISFILTLFGATAAHAELMEGKCTYVQDGDSLKLIPQGSTEEIRVRLYGIDAPEKGQEFSGQSRALLNKLVRNKQLRLEIRDKDSYGRYIAAVYVGDTYVNREMIRAGLAWFYEHHADLNRDADLARALAAAKKSHLGIWSSPSPISPRQYRETHGNFHKQGRKPLIMEK